MAEYSESSREMMFVLYLNTRNVLVHRELHSIGSPTFSTVSTREIVRLALVHEATAVVLVHNHPSGEPEPGPEDREVTGRVYEACRLFEIKLVDHIVLGEGRYFSFHEHGLFPPLDRVGQVNNEGGMT
jgi:DNA repair protein RadC